jgi:uncharacterized repeat protein (TIGR03803 family)
LKVIYQFTGGADGNQPNAAPTQGSDGNFYGTTSTGGDSNFCGTIYRVTPEGAFTLLHQFNSVNGCLPNAPLIQASDGNFYGTTVRGGLGNGVVYKLTPSGTFSVLYQFMGTADGANPYAPLLQASDGNFYGATEAGATFNGGTIFRITPAGMFSVLRTLNPTTDGAAMFSSLIQATDGNLYGMNEGGGDFGYGNVFELTLGGTYSVLYNFDYFTSGGASSGALNQDTTGVLYGTADGGGTYLEGTAFSLDVGLGAFVKLLPTVGKAGQSIGIFGNGFRGTSSVRFHGTSASFTVISDTYITAVVPTGATTGRVSVAAPGGSLSSNSKFRVLP